MSERGLEQRLSLITLGVSDLEKSTQFYRDKLGWKPSSLGAGQVTFFQMSGFGLALFPREELAADAGIEDVAASGFSRVALAYNVRERVEVDHVLETVRAKGARIVKPAEDAPWGGRSGYFADPDGFLWEVAWNPGFPIEQDGSIRIPD